MEKLGSIDGKGTISGSQNKTINDQLKHPGGPCSCTHGLWCFTNVELLVCNGLRCCTNGSWTHAPQKIMDLSG